MKTSLHFLKTFSRKLKTIFHNQTHPRCFLCYEIVVEFLSGRHWQETLVDLLEMAGRRPWMPIVVCCSTCDELDVVCSTFPAFPLHPCDLAGAERALTLDKFRHATMKWNQNADAFQFGNENEVQKSRMIVATDICLPLITSSGESSMSSSVLINYSLPTKKELLLFMISQTNLSFLRKYCLKAFTNTPYIYI